MSSDDVTMFIDESGSILESLIKSRTHLDNKSHLLSMLDEVIEAELELALMAAKKAKSEILKTLAKSNVVTPIK